MGAGLRSARATWPEKHPVAGLPKKRTAARLDQAAHHTIHATKMTNSQQRSDNPAISGIASRNGSRRVDFRSLSQRGVAFICGRPFLSPCS
jgi:hypothetical protein